MKKVDLKLYGEYERIQKEYNKLRKKLIKKTKRYTDENTGGNVPAMVVPERKRKIPLRTAMKMSRREMWRRINALRSVVKEGEKGFFKKFKASYFELYKQVIGEEPEAFNDYRYSEQQIAEMSAIDKDRASFMESYNALFQMPAEIFFYLLKRGDIPAFKMIYAEVVGGVSYYESVVDRVSDISHGWKRMIRRGEISQEDLKEFTTLSERQKGKATRDMSRTFSNKEKTRRGIDERREANTLENFEDLEM